MTGHEDGFTLLPAIDLIAGRSVRLQGADEKTSSLDADPRDVAAQFVGQGARWLHLADLDRAFGRADNQDLVCELIAAYPQVSIQVSGGLRTLQDAEPYLGAGAGRVNLASSALANPAALSAALAAAGGAISVSVDVRAGQLYARGEGILPLSFVEALDWLGERGAATVVVTDVERDGALSGPNLDVIVEARARTGATVIASGGISSLADLNQVAAVAQGAIVGKALYTGQLTVSGALAMLTQRTGHDPGERQR